MVQLKSLQDQATALRLAFDQKIQVGQTLEEVRAIYHQLKEVEKLIYERKVMLKNQGTYLE